MSDAVRVRIHVPYDTAAIAQVIAPILGFDPGPLTERLHQGPMLLAPCSRQEAKSLVEALSHFGVIGDIESVARSPVQSLGRLPTMPAKSGAASRVGRYVFGAFGRRKAPAQSKKETR
jgi:hypothetical protein